MGKPIEKALENRWENPTFPPFLSRTWMKKSLASPTNAAPRRHRDRRRRRRTRRRRPCDAVAGAGDIASAGDRRDANAQRGGHGEVQCWPNAGHKGLEPTPNSPKLLRFRFFTIKVLQKPPSLHAQEPETIPCPKRSVIRKLATTQTSPPPDQKRFLRAF